MCIQWLFSKLHEWVLLNPCKSLTSVFCQCKLIRVRYLPQCLPIDKKSSDPELEECDFSQNRLDSLDRYVWKVNQKCHYIMGARRRGMKTQMDRSDRSFSKQRKMMFHLGHRDVTQVIETLHCMHEGLVSVPRNTSTKSCIHMFTRICSYTHTTKHKQFILWRESQWTD